MDAQPKVNLTARSPFEVEVGELADLARYGVSVPAGAGRLELGPCTFERYVHRDPIGFKTVYWRRVA